jgi:general stress protein YciG
VTSRFWLGPFAVVRERRHYHGVRYWMIVTRSGHPYKIRIPYQVDAQTACDALNRAGGVKVPPPKPRAPPRRPPSGRRGGGFAWMTPEERRIVAQKGGRAVVASGTGHLWTHEEAQEAGRRGGLERARRDRERIQNERA